MTTTPSPQPSAGAHPPASTDDLVLDTLREHAASLLGTARRYSICTDDAHDAYQRAAEIFLRRAHRLDREGALPWLRTVVKHEALAVRAARQRFLGGGDVDLDAREAREAATPEERAADAEALTRSAEALQRLKPQEVRALLLKAQGHSYREICALTGWSYTKVNRCLTEGRRRFLDRYAGIESGAECGRWTNMLSAIADGEASPEDLLAVRPHLRNCPGCRARVAEFRRVPQELRAVVPVAALAFGGGSGGGAQEASGALLRAYEAVAGGVSDRIAASAQRMHAGLEAASTGKLAAVAMSATALGGGVAVVDGPAAGARWAAPKARPVVPTSSAPERARRATHVPAAGLVPARTGTAPPVADASPSVPHRATSPSAPAEPEQREFGFEAGGDAAPRAAAEPAAAAADEFGGAEVAASGVPAAGAAGTRSSAGGEFGP